MKIAISASGPTLDAEVDPRFGRCQYLVIADPDTMEFEAVSNTSAGAASGAGISTAQMIVDGGVGVVLTGNCGPNAHQVLSSASVQIITGVSGKIEDVIKDYRSGKYQASAQANVPDHYGVGSSGTGGGAGMGMGRGMGGGRGMRKGGGRGMGMGGGMGRGMGLGAGNVQPVSQMPQSQDPQDDIQALKAQSQALAEQLAEIQRQIKKLEDKKAGR